MSKLNGIKPGDRVRVKSDASRFKPDFLVESVGGGCAVVVRESEGRGEHRMSALDRAAEAAGEVVIFVDGDGQDIHLGGGLGPRVLRDIARAVLMAVREPGEGVRVRGAESVLANEARCAYIKADDAFTAMIDAILSEGEPK